MLGFITTRRHNEIVAGLAGDVRAAEASSDALTRKLADLSDHFDGIAEALVEAEQAAAKLRARLALYEGPRNRGQGGRFVSAKVPA